MTFSPLDLAQRQPHFSDLGLPLIAASANKENAPNQSPKALGIDVALASEASPHQQAKRTEAEERVGVLKAVCFNKKRPPKSVTLKFRRARWSNKSAFIYGNAHEHSWYVYVLARYAH